MGNGSQRIDNYLFVTTELIESAVAECARAQVDPATAASAWAADSRTRVCGLVFLAASSAGQAAAAANPIDSSARQTLTGSSSSEFSPVGSSS